MLLDRGDELRKAIPVLHVTTGLGLGGAEMLLVECADASRAYGYCPLVVSLQSGGGNRARLEERGIPVIELGAPASFPSYRALACLARVTALFRPAVVQTWMYHANLFMVAALATVQDISAEQVSWGIFNTAMDLSRYSWRLRAVLRVGAWLSRKPAAIVYNAEQAKKDHESIGYKARRALVINNGINTKHFSPDADIRKQARFELGIGENERVAIVAARNDPQKDWPTILSAIAKVEGLTTVAVGLGTENLPDQARLLRLGPRLDMASLYRVADFFILASAFGEGTSVAMAEAMASGLPVIITDVGDNARFARDAGYVVPKGDPDALALRISELTHDETLCRKFGLVALTTAESEFNLIKSFTPLFHLWDKLAVKPK